MQPSDNSPRIEASLDGALTTPKSYSWSLTYERQLPKQLVLSISYLGREGKHLLAQRDAMALGNLVDPSSKTDWYTAGTQLAKLFAQHAGIDANGDFTDPSRSLRSPTSKTCSRAWPITSVTPQPTTPRKLRMPT